MTTYLVTGSDGHLGSTIVSLLASRKMPVRGLRLLNSSSAAPPMEKVFRGDVTKPETLGPFFSVEGGICIHTAGIVSIGKGEDGRIWDVNVEGTKNVIEACKRGGVRRLVYVSSVHAFSTGKGIVDESASFDSRFVEGTYAKSKAEATDCVLHANGLEVVVVHPSGILGPGDWGKGHLTGLIRDYLSGHLRFCVKGGYDIVDVRDVAQGIVAAADMAHPKEQFILSGRWCSIKELLDEASLITGLRPVGMLPLWFAKATAPFAELYYMARKKPMLFSRYAIRVVEDPIRFSSRKARDELGYTTRPLEETVRDTIRWIESHPSVSQ